MWGNRPRSRRNHLCRSREPKVDQTAITKAAKLLGAAKNPMIVCGGGAQEASAEVTALSAMLQAPVLGYRRGRGVLDSRDPLSVTLPLGRELWGEADVVLAVGSRLLIAVPAVGHRQIPQDRPDRRRCRGARPPAQAGGRADRQRRADPAAHPRRSALAQHQARLAPGRHGGAAGRLGQRLREAIGPQIAYLDAIRAELPEDGILVDEVTQMGFAARLAFPVYGPRTFLSPGYQDNLGWGFATALGAQDARRNVPVVSISGDGGFMFTANEMATAVRHRIPLTAIVFNDGAFGNVRRIQQERFGDG